MFDPTKVDAISAAMAHVLHDPARQADLRAHGLAQAKRFSWDASAQRAIESFEEVQRRRAAAATVSVVAGAAARKPRLAYVSPLPPARSGIAAYSAELLPELARHYDIELVLAQESVDDPVLDSHFPQRSIAWFDEHAHTFEHIVYQFGNSAFHSHMFGLLERHPGVVVLHDFFLSGVVSHAEVDHELPNHYCRSLYLAHGYGALAEEKQDRTASILTYPCNKAVLDRATGVIVHSAHAVALGNRWYGPEYADGWRVLPLVCLRPGPDTSDRFEVRAALGFGPADYVVCSFGVLSAPKCNDRLVEAWIDSTLGRDPHCHLVFVGELAQGRFGIALRDRIAAHPRIKITGYADTSLYRRYLAAADAAVQLRGSSRGETSGAVLDCLSYGLPTIANAHGSAAEVPEHACLRLEDAFTQEALRAALERMHGDDALRARLANAAAAYMEKTHAPARIAALYRDAIAQFARDSRGQAEQDLIASIAASSANVAGPDLMQAAAAIAANRPRSGARQVLVDIDTAGMEAAVLRTLLTQAPCGWRIEPVRHDGARHRYARRYALDLIGRPDLRIEDAVAEAAPGDVWLTLEGNEPAAVPAKWRAAFSPAASRQAMRTVWRSAWQPR
jgi:glycosyltransferase involved in cell wall biosynthesis